MIRRPLAVAAALLCALAATPSFASRHAGARVSTVAPRLFCDNNARCRQVSAPPATSHRQRRAGDHGRAAHRSAPDLVTVDTAAGIAITVAPVAAAPMQGFIADLVYERGYKPARIKCYSLARTHVANSLHFRGLACDFDQHGWGKTARAMYRVRDLARKWGLRDGSEFADWGHIDMGLRSARRGTRQ